MKNKWLPIVLIMLLALFLAACGGTASAPVEEEAAPVEEEAAPVEEEAAPVEEEAPPVEEEAPAEAVAVKPGSSMTRTTKTPRAMSA